MQYRHSFHAGNFADVHKHIALLALLRTLQKKAKGFQYLDTHAGEGLYDLAGADSRQGNESDSGIARLERNAGTGSGSTHETIRDYLETVDRIRRAHGNKRSLYPGSPLLAATHLRAVDQALCVESQAQSARALQRVLESSASLIPSVPHVLHADGYHEVSARLPPPQRRGLTLIDPPYESPHEEQHLTAALRQGLTRFETGVFAIWYPIKKQYDTDLMLARVLRGVARPSVTIELCVHRPDHTAGLNGSGMLVINPPWQFDTDAGQWQPELHALLGGDSGSLVKWLVNE